MNAQHIVTRLLEDNDIDVEQLVRGALGFDALLPRTWRESDHGSHMRRYREVYTFNYGVDLVVRVYSYDEHHSARSDSVFISISLYVTNMQPFTNSANVFSVEKSGLLPEVVGIVSDVIKRVGAAHAEWAKTIPAGLKTVNASHTESLAKKAKSIISEGIGRLSHLSVPKV